VGWKGLLTDPHLDGSRDVVTGIRQARSLLLRILDTGLPCATEFLDPITPQYLADLVSWAVIGARTSESQVHRALASGLSMPVGFKNATDGSLEAAVNGMTAAREPHAFLGIDADGRSAVIETRGNPDRHLVLRGGRGRPNYGPDDVARARRLAAREGVPRPVMVDCSHDNSGKDHTRQGPVWRAVLSQVRAGEAAICGLLLESNLEAGRQELRDGVAPRPGLSVTDACVGFEETEALLHEAAAAVRAVRALGHAAAAGAKRRGGRRVASS
jgi:3-deoxy-7-phosphoheptulonate synthase